MRRAEVTSIDLADVDFQRNTVRIIQKGGQQRRCQVSREGMRAIQDYIEKERAGDAAKWRASPALFLPAASVARSSGRLAPVNVNTLMAEVCKLAGIEGRTPHSARHGMGVHIIKRPAIPGRCSASSAIPTRPQACSTCSLAKRSSRPCWMSGKEQAVKRSRKEHPNASASPWPTSKQAREMLLRVVYPSCLGVVHPSCLEMAHPILV
jgi:hypothetical protein